MSYCEFREQGELASRLAGKKFIFAKTMPDTPHFYTLRRDWIDNHISFDMAVDLIRTHGRVGRYGGREYTYWDANGFTYWTMGAPIAATILINRRVSTYQTVYDDVAGGYDDMYRTVDRLEESREAVRFCDIQEGHSVLDAGCGTGLLFDELPLSVRNSYMYIGHDPSREMLEVAEAKKVEGETLWNCSFEDLHLPGGAFDRVLMLFCVPNYIEPSILLPKVNHLLKPGGKAFLFWQRPGYKVSFYSKYAGDWDSNNPQDYIEGEKFNERYTVQTICRPHE